MNFKTESVRACSLSQGDIIELNDKHFKIKSIAGPFENGIYVATLLSEDEESKSETITLENWVKKVFY